MKLSIIALISVFALFGLVTLGTAQTSPPSDTAPPAQSAPSSGDAAKPSDGSTEIKGEVKTDNRNTTIDVRSGRPEQRDDASALPRTSSGERGTIFGMTPTLAIIAGGALLLVVILAIVALGRGGSSDVYVDRDRRM